MKKLKLKSFFTIFHDFFTIFFPQITSYHRLLIFVNRTLFSLNLGQKMVLRAGLEPTTLCLEGRCN